jgi:hypothetical protein
VLFFILATVETVAKTAFFPLVYFELFCQVIFFIELVARFWVSIERKRIAKYGPVLGRVRYFITFSGLIDCIAVVPYWVVFFTALGVGKSPWQQSAAFLSAIRYASNIYQFDLAPAFCLRSFIRIFRVFHLMQSTTYVRAVNLFKTLIKNNKEIIITCIMYEVTLFLVTSTALYYSEVGAQPDGGNTFASIPAAMYDAVLLLTANAGATNAKKRTLALILSLFSGAEF